MNYTASELSCSIKSLTLSTKECAIFIVIPNDSSLAKKKIHLSTVQLVLISFFMYLMRNANSLMP